MDEETPEEEFLEEAEQVPEPITAALMLLTEKQEIINRDIININKRLDELTPQQQPDIAGPAEFPGETEEIEVKEEPSPAPAPAAEPQRTGRKRRVKFGRRKH